MYEQVTVLIYDWRELILKGIEKVLVDHFPMLQIKTARSIDDFWHVFRRYKPSVLFINYKKLTKVLSSIDPEFWFQRHLIVIGEKPVNLGIQVAFYLPISASVNYLVRNFSTQVMSFYETANSQEDGELTTREQEILRLVALGYTNQQIADKLFISPHTVITHRKNITKKLGIKSISGLTIYAILNNLISLDELEEFNGKMK